MDGMYKYCFGNEMSSMTPKTVMFNMEVGDAPKEHNENDGTCCINVCCTWLVNSVVPSVIEQGQLEAMVGELSQGLGVIKHEQEYMEVRERIHRMSKFLVICVANKKLHFCLCSQ